MKKTLVICAFCLLPLGAGADSDLQARRQQSIAVVKDFMTTLKGQLQAAMKAGGPAHAIGVCKRIAPAIAQEESRKHGWTVGRTSLKTRNPNNRPDAWELKVLRKFEARKQAGEDPRNMVYDEVVQEGGRTYYRFMKAIPTGKLCLQCHGSNLSAPVKAKLDQLYPQDEARGFKLGDIRGAFIIKQPM